MDMVEEYLKSSQMQYRDALDVIEEFSKELSEMGGKCMDVGCGPGETARKLILPRLAADAYLIGTDISKRMIEFAKSAHNDEERLSFTQLDIETPNLPSNQIGQYENVLSFYCLHWCQDTRQAFENIYKLLQPGGKSLVLFLGWNDGFDAYDRIPKDPQYKAYKEYMQDADRFIPYFHRCKASRAALIKILEDIGFEVLHCSRREKTFIYKDMQLFKDHAMSVNPFISRIPNYLKEEFTNILVREFASKKIQFLNKSDNGQTEYSILDRYYILVAYMQKPLSIC